MGYGADMCIIRAFTIPVESPAILTAGPAWGKAADGLSAYREIRNNIQELW